MNRAPFFFTFRDKVSGRGFLAEVVAKNGRLIGVREDDGVWMYGVNPGGMAANGENESKAYAEFRKSYSTILNDIAQEAKGFDDFKNAVREFFYATNHQAEADWLAAVKEVRQGKVKIKGMPVRKAESKRLLEVELVPDGKARRAAKGFEWTLEPETLQNAA